MAPLRHVVLLLLLLVAFTLAGCAKRPEGSGADTPEQDAQGRYMIEAANSNRFIPATAKVPVGATVIWTSDGIHDVDHTGDAFKSQILQDGQTFTHTFTEPGEYDYVCNLHQPTMDGTIIVE